MSQRDTDDAPPTPPDAPEGGGARRGGMRQLLLKYVLYDALARPSVWHGAKVRDTRRRQALVRAAQRCLAGGGTAVVLGGSGEVPAVQLALAKAAAAAAAPPVVAVEPLKPFAAALARAAGRNGLGPGDLRVVHRLRAEAVPGAEAVLVAPGLDDVNCFAAEADGLLEATNVPGLGVRAVVPARVRLRAVLLELPAQVNPVRAPVGTVSGFDLAEFNRFAR